MSVPTLPTLSPAQSLEEQAIELIAPRKFHQQFILPATADHGPMRVTYAIAGKEHGDDTPTILFCGGMFGSRWQAPFQDFIATKEGVRILYIDRPGFGGTTPVPLPRRISIFSEIVPALLAHLQIPHVSLGCQSAGTIFALNLLLTQPQILSPTHPTVTLFSPWVHTSHTGVTFLLAASKLPNFLLNHWSNLTGFMINTAAPSFAASGGIFTAVSNWFSGVSAVSLGTSTAAEDIKKDNEILEKLCMDSYGVGIEMQKERSKQVMRFAFAEECSGGNDEARLCLKSIAGADWGVLDEYPAYIEKLKGIWEDKVEAGGSKLQVRVLLAEDDVMIGAKGMKYIEECWTEEKCGKGIDVKCVTLEGTDHDSVLDPARGAMGEVYNALAGNRAAFEDAEETVEGA